MPQNVIGNSKKKKKKKGVFITLSLHWTDGEKTRTFRNKKSMGELKS